MGSAVEVYEELSGILVDELDSCEEDKVLVGCCVDVLNSVEELSGMLVEELI